MALIESTTPRGRHQLLQQLDGPVRQAAFAAANPLLAREVAQLVTDPRRIRKLSVDTACEALGWIEDPDVIAALANADARSSVCSAARDRLRRLEVTVIPNISPNQDNVRLRATKALERPLDEVPAALLELKEIPEDLFQTWFDGLNTAQVLEILPTLAGEGRMTSLLRSMLEELINRLGQAPAPDAVACLRSVVNAGDSGRLLGLDLLRAWPGPWSLPAGFLATQWSQILSRPIPQITDEVLDLWRGSNRFDLILWAGLADADEIVAAANAVETGEGVIEILGVPTRAADVDVLVDALDRTGVLAAVMHLSPYGQTRAFDRLLRLRGLQLRTVELLLRVAPAQIKTQWFYNGFVNRPTRDLVRALAPSIDAGDVVKILQRCSSDSDELAPALWLLEDSAARPGGAKIITELTGPYARGTREISGWIAERAESAFGSNEASWAVFWTLLASPGESSFDDLLASVTALA